MNTTMDSSVTEVSWKEKPAGSTKNSPMVTSSTWLPYSSVKNMLPGQTHLLFTHSTGPAVLKQLVAESVGLLAHIQHSRMLYVQKMTK